MYPLINDAHEQTATGQFSLLAEVLATAGILLDPYRNAASGTAEIGPSVLADDDLAGVPAEQVHPLLAGVLLADFHVLEPIEDGEQTA